MANTYYRAEKDSLGEIKVPKNKYYGAQSQRSLQNFKIGKETMPKEIIWAYAVLKKAAAITNTKQRRLDSKISKTVQRVCDEIIDGKITMEHFPLKVWQTGSGTQTNMNVNEVISNRAIEILGGKLGSKTPVHPNDHVNMSQSTNDTFPSAINIAASFMVVNSLIPALKSLKKSLDLKSKEFKDVIKLGRTHLQDATPVSLGQEFSGYSTQIENSIKRLEKALESTLELAIGGTAVGTGINTKDGFDKLVVQEISKITKLKFKPSKNKFEAIATQDSIVELSGVLKTIAASLFKIANDIRWLASGPRGGFGELDIPANEPGSSIMPGKINPTQSEALTMVCVQVMGNDATISFAGASGNFELNVFRPVMAYNIVQSLRLLSDSVNSFNEKCAVGIKANQKNIDKHLYNSLMLVTALSPHIGYDKAAKVAKKAHKDGTTLKEAIKELGFMSEDEFDKLIKPKDMIKPNK